MFGSGFSQAWGCQGFEKVIGNKKWLGFRMMMLGNTATPGWRWMLAVYLGLSARVEARTTRQGGVALPGISCAGAFTGVVPAICPALQGRLAIK